jgi:transposase-like protein
VTEAVPEEVKEWQNRHLEKSYAIVYLDALRVKGKQDGKSCIKERLRGLGGEFRGPEGSIGARTLVRWTAESEGAKFWFLNRTAKL